jgi:hypothetical protein
MMFSPKRVKQRYWANAAIKKVIGVKAAVLREKPRGGQGGRSG